MRLLAMGVWMVCGVAMAQSAGSSGVVLKPVEAFKLSGEGPGIRRRVQAGQPFTVAGTRGVVLGQQEGTFEAWVLPVKLLSHFTIRANVDGYPVPIDVNAAASEIEVRPDHTTITYSHIAFTRAADDVCGGWGGGWDGRGGAVPGGCGAAGGVYVQLYAGDALDVAGAELRCAESRSG